MAKELEDNAVLAVLGRDSWRIVDYVAGFFGNKNGRDVEWVTASLYRLVAEGVIEFDDRDRWRAVNGDEFRSVEHSCVWHCIKDAFPCPVSASDIVRRLDFDSKQASRLVTYLTILRLRGDVHPVGPEGGDLWSICMSAPPSKKMDDTDIQRELDEWCSLTNCEIHDLGLAGGSGDSRLFLSSSVLVHKGTRGDKRNELISTGLTQPHSSEDQARAAARRSLYNSLQRAYGDRVQDSALEESCATLALVGADTKLEVKKPIVGSVGSDVKVGKVDLKGYAKPSDAASDVVTENGADDKPSTRHASTKDPDHKLLSSCTHLFISIGDLCNLTSWNRLSTLVAEAGKRVALHKAFESLLRMPSTSASEIRLLDLSGSCACVYKRVGDTGNVLIKQVSPALLKDALVLHSDVQASCLESVVISALALLI
jgi:hypothetical protein